MRRQRRRHTAVLLLAACSGLPIATGPTASAHHPHGCVSVSDYKAGVDLAGRRAVLSMNSDQPCTFRFSAGDTFSGSGRFTVSCSTGGYYHHPDFQGGQYPPVADVPVPKPCAEGARVTVEAYRAGTGGAVIATGARTP